MPLLKEINALEIIDAPLTGGTTKPLLILCDDGNQYVLKIFKKKHADQRCYTGAEVCAYLLAKEFGLFIPDGALISIPEKLTKLIQNSNPELYSELLTKDFSRPCFGSLYKRALPTYSPALLEKYFELHELETIYAFDTFILNEDRKGIKPNILKGEEHYFLIDHDKAFEGSVHALKTIKGNNLVHYRNHLFFEILKKKEKKSKGNVRFETFEEYLRLLDLRNIKLQILRLEELCYEVEECYDWINYFEYIKSNSSIFITLLKNSINS